MKTLRITTLGALIVLVIGFVACGGGGASSAPSTTSPGAMASSVNLGDAAADDIVAFEITVDSISLTSASGSTTILSTPRRLEMTHLSATVEHLSIGNIPPGNYTSASIAWSSPEVTFLNAANAPVEVQPPPLQPKSASGTATVSMNFTVSAASVLNFDLDVAQSVTVNTNFGTATFFPPVFTFTAGRGMAEAEREAETGEIEDMLGTVTSASASSVTITAGNSGASLTFTVNANTKLEPPLTSAAQLVAGQVIWIEGTVQSDGSIVAKDIEAEAADGNGAAGEGLVTSVGATSFTMIVHDASGASTSRADLGKTVTVDASSANFGIGKTKINTSGFGFASIADLHKGQRVEVDSDTPKSACPATGCTVSDDGSFNGVKKIKLKQQALTGSVSNISGANFTLTVPADSAFARLAGTTTVQVVNNGAQMKNAVSVSSGATVRVRGLLFAPAGNYTLVAGRITTP